jgi:hypothetical protein
VQLHIFADRRDARSVSRYKVWVQVERIEVTTDRREVFADVGLPDCLGTYDTLSEAQAHIRQLPGWLPDGSENR